MSSAGARFVALALQDPPMLETAERAIPKYCCTANSILEENGSTTAGRRRKARTPKRRRRRRKTQHKKGQQRRTAPQPRTGEAGKQHHPKGGPHFFHLPHNSSLFFDFTQRLLCSIPKGTTAAQPEGSGGRQHQKGGGESSTTQQK